MFSRGSRTSGRHARTERSRREQSRPARSLADELDASDEPSGPAEADPADAGGEEIPAGPYDSAEAPDGVRRLDLGSLQIPSVPGVEVRVQANKDGVVQQVFLTHGESALQLGVFAAPRTDPIWDEVRADIRKSLFDDGVAAEEAAGPYGTELRARVRTQDGLKDLRFVGVNGPRWMVRAVYQGPAAVDPQRAGPLAECLRGLVVDRGTEARPAKEPLPLRLSQEMAAQVASGGGPVVSGAAPAAAGAAPASAQPGGAQPGGAQPGGAQPGGAQPGGAAPRRKPSPRPRRQANQAAPGPEHSRG